MSLLAKICEKKKTYLNKNVSSVIKGKKDKLKILFMGKNEHCNKISCSRFIVVSSLIVGRHLVIWVLTAHMAARVANLWTVWASRVCFSHLEYLFWRNVTFAEFRFV